MTKLISHFCGFKTHSITWKLLTASLCDGLCRVLNSCNCLMCSVTQSFTPFNHVDNHSLHLIGLCTYCPIF